MSKRFAVVIGVAAAGVMALGTQTAAALPKYDTKVSIHKNQNIVNGLVESGRKRCTQRRLVVLFKQRPGADRMLLRTRSWAHRRNRFPARRGSWKVRDRRLELRPGDLLYAMVMRERRKRYVCGVDRTRMVPWEQGQW